MQPPPKCKRCGTDKRHRLKIHGEWLCAKCIEIELDELRPGTTPTPDDDPAGDGGGDE